MKKPKTNLVRSTFPKVRIVWVKGEKFYQVDARRKGTAGKQETFSTEKAALTRAGEIAADYAKNGTAGLALPADLRFMAETGAAMVKPFGKTILEACEFLRDHLQKEQAKTASALVGKLAEAWKAEKESGKFKQLRESTLKGIRDTAAILVKQWGERRILAMSQKDITDYLDSLPKEVGLQRKYNLVSLFSQFFNWTIAKEHIAINPCDRITITVNGKPVEIFTPAQAENVLRVCEKKFRRHVLFHAISLFAGLRPEECLALKWEQIHLEERTIEVLPETSKIKEGRRVPIEDVLYDWLREYKPKDAKGFVTPQESFKKYTLQIHIAAGYRGTVVSKKDGKVVRTLVNTEAPEWTQDIMRHSYGSYWLAKNANRTQLAENMGNSLQIIKKHYKKVVSKADTAAYWVISPNPTEDEEEQKPASAKPKQGSTIPKAELQKAEKKILNKEEQEWQEIHG